ncbi:MAG: GNAT family N-acetyltransferase [Bacteroidetes bacterium]|nr:GNAT family N-acetyltransferase [Bacteroidota bacterium]
MKILRFTFENKKLLDQAFLLRTKVFIEEQKVDSALEFENEEEAIHYLLFVGKKAVATGRWRQTPNGIKLERFVTLKNYRAKGYGLMLLQHILTEVIPLNQPIYLHAQISALGFYKRNGFSESGKPFDEAGIAHYLMFFRP